MTKIKGTNQKIVKLQVFSDSAHQAKLERYQGHIKLDDKHAFQGAHGGLTYDLHVNIWIPHIEINNPSNCKADTQKKVIKKKCFFFIGKLN